MDKKRLLELAGVSSNMSNPSQEPDSEIPGSEDPTGAPGSAGYEDTGGDDKPNSICYQIKDIAERGLEEDPQAALEEILSLIAQKDSENGDDSEGKIGVGHEEYGY